MFWSGLDWGLDWTGLDWSGLRISLRAPKRPTSQFPRPDQPKDTLHAISFSCLFFCLSRHQLPISLRHLHHHGPSHNYIVGKLAGQGAGAGQVDVGDASETLGHDATGGLVEGGEEGAAGDAARGEGAVGRAGSGIALQLNGGTGRDGGGARTAGHSKGREGSEDEVGALRAALDEGSGEREDLLGGERGVEGLGNGDGFAGSADKRLVAGLDGEDGAGGGEDGTVRYEGSGAEVGRHADVFEHSGGADHASGIGEAEVIRAGLDGLDAGLRDSALQKADVVLFCLADLEKAVDLLLLEAEPLEVGRRELGESLLVEGRFEPLESKRTGGEWVLVANREG